ncbi:MAG: tRNA-specific adenosine deaminase, partial [Candidatus Dadabacteria bacterium]
MILKKDEQLMRLALAEAEEAGRMGEVPVGAVIVDGSGRVLSTGRNLRESS